MFVRWMKRRCCNGFGALASQHTVRYATQQMNAWRETETLLAHIAGPDVAVLILRYRGLWYAEVPLPTWEDPHFETFYLAALRWLELWLWGGTPSLRPVSSKSCFLLDHPNREAVRNELMICSSAPHAHWKRAEIHLFSSLKLTPNVGTAAPKKPWPKRWLRMGVPIGIAVVFGLCLAGRWLGRSAGMNTPKLHFEGSEL